MSKLYTLLMLISLTLAAPGGRADVLVLVHGYLGGAASWEASGINGMLQANGWHRAGVLPGGALLTPAVEPEGNRAYSVQLPSLAPMMIQADHLQAMLQEVSAMNPGQPVIIAAHSAGGVVARIVLARGGVQDAKALITIASPHLGTTRAIQALDATDTPWPFCIVRNFFSNGAYRAIKNSRGALLDLTPASPGSLLFWLNGQPHPDIGYHSIISTGPQGIGDELVPLFSQDMNNVPALRGRSAVTTVVNGHGLDPQDGHALILALNSLDDAVPGSVTTGEE